MPRPKRSRRERTDEWASIKQWTLWPEQELYEQIRPLLLFGETAGERAKETGAAARTLSRKADEFERYGMQSLFSSGEQGGERATRNSLPPEIRQLIVDLHAEHPLFHDFCHAEPMGLPGAPCRYRQNFSHRERRLRAKDLQDSDLPGGESQRWTVACRRSRKYQKACMIWSCKSCVQGETGTVKPKFPHDVFPHPPHHA